MKLASRSVAIRTLAFLAGAALAVAQPAQRAANPNASLVSPEVLPDHHVVFRIYAPKASSVEVTGDFVTQGRATGGKLTKDDRGVWSIAVGPLQPDLYTYTLTVDGVPTMDPKSANVNVGGATLENLVDVPGAEAAFESMTRVPHGEVHKAWYFSNNLNQMRRVHIYTPPGYETGSAKYPVFYLLHGAGDDDSGWSSIGRAGFIMDNLIAAGKAKPMIVVMPNGGVTLPNANMNRSQGTTADGRPNVSASVSMTHDAFTEDLLTNVIPYVETHYRALTTQPNRALAGLSMGGAETLRIAPQNVDKFAYVGVFSMGWHDHLNPDLESRNEKFFGNPAQTNKQVKLFWIGCGTADTIIGTGAKRLDGLFTKRGINHEFHESEGGHTWINWRAYLRDFAPLLFR